MSAHETWIIILLAVVGTVALGVVVFVLCAVGLLMATAARMIRKAWRGDE